MLQLKALNRRKRRKARSQKMKTYSCQKTLSRLERMTFKHFTASRRKLEGKVSSTSVKSTFKRRAVDEKMVKLLEFAGF